MEPFSFPEHAPPISVPSNAEVVGERRTQGMLDNTWQARAMEPAQYRPRSLSEAMLSGPCYDNVPFNGYYNCYSHWSGSSASVDWEQTLRGVVRIDNRHSSQSSSLTYTQSTSGNASMTISGDLHSGGEATVKVPIINFALASLSGQIGIAASGTWSWSSSTTIEDQWNVPAYKVGYTYSYNAGGNVGGKAHYDLWTLDDYAFIGTWVTSVGGTPPSNGAYNFKHVTADN